MLTYVFTENINDLVAIIQPIIRVYKIRVDNILHGKSFVQPIISYFMRKNKLVEP